MEFIEFIGFVELGRLEVKGIRLEVQGAANGHRAKRMVHSVKE